MSITIKEISTGKEWDADKPLLPLWQQLCTNTGETGYFYDNDERNPNWIRLQRLECEWALRGGKGAYPFESCVLKPDRFQVIDTDYIAKGIIREVLKNNIGITNKEYNFILDELGIPLSQIE